LDNKIFDPIANIVKTRRPGWQFVVEDSLLRILTMQFIVDWGIIDEITQMDNGYEIVECVSHQQFGIVVSVRYVGGK